MVQARSRDSVPNRIGRSGPNLARASAPLPAWFAAAAVVGVHPGLDERRKGTVRRWVRATLYFSGASDPSTTSTGSSHRVEPARWPSQTQATVHRRTQPNQQIRWVQTQSAIIKPAKRPLPGRTAVRFWHPPRYLRQMSARSDPAAVAGGPECHLARRHRALTAPCQ